MKSVFAPMPIYRFGLSINTHIPEPPRPVIVVKQPIIVTRLSTNTRPTK